MWCITRPNPVGRVFKAYRPHCLPSVVEASRSPHMCGWATASQAGCLVSTLLHATGSRWRVSRSSFSVNHEGVGSGGVQSLLTAPRRINPGAVASKGPLKSFWCWVASDALHRLYFLLFFHWASTGGWAHIGCHSDGVQLVQVVLNVASGLRR
jgi:hypothetical protein